MGSAYGEPFERAAASLRFEGAGVRLDGIEALKGGAPVTGAAYVEWSGSYSFSVSGAAHSHRVDCRGGAIRRRRSRV